MAPKKAAETVNRGDVLVDLGCGAGLDCLLASRQVGPRGRAYGVDMVPAMIAKARDAAKRLGSYNAHFLLGEIEHLPLTDRNMFPGLHHSCKGRRRRGPRGLRGVPCALCL